MPLEVSSRWQEEEGELGEGENSPAVCKVWELGQVGEGVPSCGAGAGWRDGLSSCLLGLPQFATNAEKEGLPSNVKGH